MKEKKKSHILNYFTSPVQIVTKSLKKKYQLLYIKFRDEPQLGKPFSAGKPSDLEKLFFFNWLKVCLLERFWKSICDIYSDSKSSKKRLNNEKHFMFFWGR